MAILFAIVLLDLIGFGIVIPLLPFYGTHFGATAWQVTALMATYSLMQLFSAPILGRLSDRYGRRPVLLFSIFGSVIGYCGLGLSHALWMAFAARALQGSCAGNIATAQAYIADVTTPQTRAKGMGMIGAAFGLGFIIGPALGGTLAGADPTNPALSLPAFLGAFLSFLAFCGAFFFLPESLPAAARSAAATGKGARPSRLESVLRALRRPSLRFLILIYFFVIFAFAGLETTFALWAMRRFGWGPRPVGYILFMVGVIGALIQGGAMGWLTRRFGEERLLLTGIAFMVLGLASVPLAHHVPMLLLANALLASGMGLTQPTVSSLVSRQAAAHELGEVMGVSQSAGSLARVCGPLFAGFLFYKLGPDMPYWAGAIIMTAVLAAGLSLLRRQPSYEDEMPLRKHG